MKTTLRKSFSAVLALVMLFTCFAITSSAEEATGYETLRINVTMYGDAQTQRGFTWYTEKPCDATVQIVDALEYAVTGFDNALVFTGKVSEWQGYYCHKVVATGLEPGTEYRYRVGSDDNDVWSVVGTFVTDNGDDSFSFIALADVQASSYENFYQASLVMQAAMKYTPDAEFVVNLGDFVNDCTNEEWNWYGETFEKANTNLTLVPVAGNHEGNITNKLNVAWFNNMFNLLPGEGDLNGVNGTYYSFDYGDVHFTVLNSNDMYPMTEAQRNWIYNDITNSDAFWKVLLLHRAPYSAGKNINKPDTLIMRDTIIEIVDETGVDMVLSGHDHMYFRTKQVAGDKVCEDTVYVTEKYNGVDTTFAVNPEGAVYILPSTAGTKRYGVNDGALGAVMDAADACFTTRSEKDEDGYETNPYAGGCFSNVEVCGDKLIYKAYVVDDDTQEVILVDEYAIMKDTAKDSNDATKLPTDVIGTIDGSVGNFIKEFFGVLIKYITVVLPEAVLGLFS